MISYLGVTIDELVTTFEDALAYSEDRTGRSYSASYKPDPTTIRKNASSIKTVDSAGIRAKKIYDDVASKDFWDSLDDEDDEDVTIDVFVDEDGRLHSLAESLSFAAEALVGFLTDYIITDEIDDEWLTLDLARGALLGLRISLPTFEEIPEVTCAYRFRIERDLKTGLPTYISAKSLDSRALLLDTLTRTSTHYEGIVSDETSLDLLFLTAGIPEAERYDLGEAISEAVFHLADEQCGIAFDAKKFRGEIMRLAARHRMHVVPNDSH